MNKKISLVLTVLIILSSANFAFAETADVTAVPRLERRTYRIS